MAEEFEVVVELSGEATDTIAGRGAVVILVDTPCIEVNAEVDASDVSVLVITDDQASLVFAPGVREPCALVLDESGLAVWAVDEITVLVAT